MKRIFYLLLFAIITNLTLNSVYANPDEKKVLMPDKNRKNYVLDKTAIIRIKPEYYVSEALFLMKNNQFRVIDKFLNTESVIKSKSENNFLAVQKAANPLLRTFIIEYDDNLTPEKFCEKLKNENPAIELAEPYKVYKFQYRPNDNRLNSQGHLNTIKAFDAWDITKGDTNIVIGISDSGTEQHHEDLKDNIAVNYNEIPNNNIDDDENGYIDDYNGYNFNWKEDEVNPSHTGSTISHGTRVAGFSSASTDNDLGIAGTGFKSKFFPVKVANRSGYAIYGYQSIIYAADRGFDVLNLSWGGPSGYSETEQAIIDYAISKDVAIISSAGNTETGVDNYATFYPAGYNGVMGVGQTTTFDLFANDVSTIGASCHILSPGAGSYTTNIGNSYVKSKDGTSFSSPVVAGAVALVRAKFPELTALQAIQHVKNTADDISEFNVFAPKLLPKRLNIFNAVNTNPFSNPGIRPVDYKFLNSEGVESERFFINDIVNLDVDIVNELGDAVNLTAELSVGRDAKASVRILKSTVPISLLKSGESITLQGFEFEIIEENSEEIIFRLEISSDSGYVDFHKFLFVPTKKYSTFSNEKITFSLSDNGRFGYYKKSSSQVYGEGFKYLNLNSQIYNESGLIAAEGIDKGELFILNDFMTVQPFGGDDPNLGIVNDGFAPTNRRIGIDISQEVFFNKEISNAAQIKLGVTNSSKDIINDVSVGYFLDFDLGDDSDNNRTKLFNEAIPDGFDTFNAAAQIAYIPDSDFPVFGVAVATLEKNAIAQASGLNYDDFGDDMREDFAKQFLNSGTEYQKEGTDDIGIVIGMKYNGQLVPDASKYCYVCIGAAESEEDLQLTLSDCIAKINTNVYDELNVDLNIYPQPASDEFNLSGKLHYSGIIKIRIFDILGNEVSDSKNIFVSDQYLNEVIEIGDLPAGKYFIAINYGTEINTIPITVVK